jgi:hypothetical protein
VDKILVPPTHTLKTVLESNDDYAAFAQALAEYNLLDQFNVSVSNGTYHSIFVPTNDAMEQFIPDSTYGYREMLLYHMVETYDQPLFTFGTEDGLYESMWEEAEIEVVISGSNMTLNGDATVIGTGNDLAISGVVQQVDKILSPPTGE